MVDDFNPDTDYLHAHHFLNNKHMKKPTVILSIALMMGQGISFAQTRLSDMKQTEITQSTPMAQGRLQSRKSANDVTTFKAPAKVMTSESDTPEDVKNEIPYTDYNDNVFGVTHDNLYTSVSGYEPSWWSASYYSVSGLVNKYVYDKDKQEIYIYNPIGRYSSYSYIKGNVDPQGNITVECPQIIAEGEDEYGPWAYYVMNARITEDGYSMEPVEEDLNLHYKLDANGTLTLCEGSWVGMFEWGPYYYYDEESGQYIDVEGEYFYDWASCTVTKQSMEVFTEEPVNPGKELNVEPWILASQQMDSYSSCLMSYTLQEINACIDGDSFWIKGIIKSVPDCWIKGEIHGDEVTFKNSFICIDETNGFFQFLLAGNETFDEDEEMYLYDFAGEVTMKFDPEKKVITGSNGNTLIVNAGNKTIYYLYMWINPIIKVKTDAAPAAPLAPVFNAFYPEEDGYDPLFICSISPVDVNYNPLNQNNMFFIILIDGEPFEFTLDDLGEVYSEDATDDDTFIKFPLDFDSDNLYYWKGQVNLTTVFTGYDTIGAQAVYVTDSGDYLYSAPLIYDVNSGTVGIDEVSNSNATITDIIFTGLDGIKVTHPEKGIYLMTVTYSDGSRKTVKMVRR